MAHTFYAQSARRPATLTVGALIEQLRQMDETKPVVFKSPQFGAFGSGTTYSIDAVETVALERREQQFPASSYIDDETGETVHNEAWTQVFEAWDGVVIG